MIQLHEASEELERLRRTINETNSIINNLKDVTDGDLYKVGKFNRNYVLNLCTNISRMKSDIDTANREYKNKIHEKLVDHDKCYSR